MLSALLQELIVEISRLYRTASKIATESLATVSSGTHDTTAYSTSPQLSTTHLSAGNTLASPIVLSTSSAGTHLPDDQTYLIIEEAFLYNYRDITLDGLAGLVNLSRRQTERLLQQHYGKTFLQKKKEARMSAMSLS